MFYVSTVIENEFHEEFDKLGGGGGGGQISFFFPRCLSLEKVTKENP